MNKGGQKNLGNTSKKSEKSKNTVLYNMSPETKVLPLSIHQTMN